MVLIDDIRAFMHALGGKKPPDPISPFNKRAKTNRQRPKPPPKHVNQEQVIDMLTSIGPAAND